MDLSGLSDADLVTRRGDESLSFDERSDAAFETARRAGLARDAAHAAFHGRSALNYGRVERRRGYRGSTVCLDCYYGKEWVG
jgi:hypothetical protein